MAVTTAAANPLVIPKLWSTDLLAQAENQTYWHRFEGAEGSGMPVIRKDDLTRQAGDTIHMDMVLALTGAGTAGETNALRGSEEALKFRQVDLVVSDLSHAVDWGFVAAQEINHDLRKTALNQLSKWLAGKIDDSIWAELTGGGTAIPAANAWYPGSATTINTLTDVDGAGRLLLNDISEVRAYAEADLKIEPFRTELGEEFYGLVVDPYVNLTLKKNTDYQAAMREAQVRGATNPLLTGSTFVWDGVIGYTSNRIPTATNTGPIRYAKNVLFGANAIVRGYAMYPDWVEEAFDYDRQRGVATKMIKGEKLAVYDLSAAGDGSAIQAIGSAVVYSSAVKPTHP